MYNAYKLQARKRVMTDLKELHRNAEQSIKPEAFRIFQNALVYSVCAEVVRNVMGTNDSTSLVILILVVGIAVYLITLFAIQLNIAAQIYRTNMVIKLVNFIGVTMLNVAVQFASTLIAQVTVTILSPGSEHFIWVGILALMSLTLLWLFNTTLLSV